MAEKTLFYPFNYFYDTVYTIAFYGSNAPMIVKGNLVLRAYFKDEAKTVPDIEHTSEYLRDEIFYETNKAIREQMEDPYNGKRELAEFTFPELGSEYRIVYNEAEIPSERYDDLLSILVSRDPYARGVAIILKRGSDGGIDWMSEREAREIQTILKNAH
ncbi:MAG: hypothetical protein LKF53_00705 [Solobacterium sp.]|jgi:hypothetical protein|nr:hypothetical protein [Solobacterium sp.]MCH4204896.1 hypothetical protein [Solobacterium sp.]MCH4226288.1 hypothetical protein [Solobacterium sp.]MCH4281689.1 hypothetical protein [Solobacterium sp.]